MAGATLDVSMNDRVLVLGAPGWFGKTAVDLSNSLGALVMTRTSKGNVLIDQSREVDIPSSFQICIDFQPTVVIDCAFVTRQLISTYGISRYPQTNKELNSRALLLQALPSVRRFIGVCSGAAVPYLLDEESDQKTDPYGHLKGIL